jgi:hypothetical protein
MSPKKTPAAQPEAEEPEVVEASEVAAEAPPEAEAEAPADEAEAAAEEAGPDPKLAKINAGVRKMQTPERDGSCDRYKSDKDGNLLVPASEVPDMLDHGFVLVDED